MFEVMKDETGKEEGERDGATVGAVEMNARYFTRVNKNKLGSDGKVTQQRHLQ